ncbi:NADH:flavin oxidoreductase/NADH oxidase [Xylariomycetidae sp. FL0641]|nr:NADH:flavin oxidoreductase/NADH oxidase [Xylariomycetidae sp. FL0641]
MSKLFQEMQVGPVRLGHRVVMAPLTRYRCDDDMVPLPMVREYYEQRASTPGTLLISEATIISREAVASRNVPGIFTEAQIAGWKGVTDAVHAKGCFLYCQLWHQGRAGNPEVHREQGTELLSASAIPIDAARATPAAMTEADIAAVVAQYAAAARNALRAGFDGVELHAANGYLIDQFLQDVSNARADGWGGSAERRARFAVAVTRAVAAAAGGPARVAVRLSPFSDFQGMGMADPYAQFAQVARALRPLGLAYLHVVEPRISGNAAADCGAGHAVDFLVKLWDNRSPVLLAGGYTAETARRAVDEKWRDYDVAVVFGRYFISTPDLVFRLKEGIPFEEYDRDTFYTPKKAEGYLDCPFSKEFLARQGQS